jgi:CheY-like chemotaxis protein
MDTRKGSPRIPGRSVVLIADDNADTRELYAIALRVEGHRVETARNGREAVDKVVSLLPDVIVMDLHMPDIDGWQAITRLQADPATSTIPVIVLTGHDFKQYLRAAALAVGACSYLMKPCLPERLACEIRGVLETRSGQRSA